MSNWYVFFSIPYVGDWRPEWSLVKNWMASGTVIGFSAVGTLQKVHFWMSVPRSRKCVSASVFEIATIGWGISIYQSLSISGLRSRWTPNVLSEIQIFLRYESLFGTSLLLFRNCHVRSSIRSKQESMSIKDKIPVCQALWRLWYESLFEQYTVLFCYSINLTFCLQWRVVFSSSSSHAFTTL